jgi:hypothetical protein
VKRENKENLCLFAVHKIVSKSAEESMRVVAYLDKT